MNNLPEELIRKIYSYVQEIVYNLVIKRNFYKRGFAWYYNLTYLDSSHNKLTSLPDHLENLTKLYCVGNKLTSLPDHLEKLIVLDCSRN